MISKIDARWDWKQISTNRDHQESTACEQNQSLSIKQYSKNGLLIETLMENVSSVNLEKHEFEKRDEFIFKTFVAFLARQETGAGADLIALSNRTTQEYEKFDCHPGRNEESSCEVFAFLAFLD